MASLGAVYYAHGRTVTAAEHEPEYLRKSQAEREREEQEERERLRKQYDPRERITYTLEEMIEGI